MYSAEHTELGYIYVLGFLRSQAPFVMMCDVDKDGTIEDHWFVDAAFWDRLNLGDHTKYVGNHF